MEKSELDRIVSGDYFVYKPKKFIEVINRNINCFDDLFNFFNGDIDYKILGCVLYKNNKRYKIRNKNYEYVRHLKGNTPKIQYQYYCLRQQNKVSDYLKYYPNDIKEFSKLRNNLHSWTSELHKNYIDCFINKNKHLKDYPYEFKPHLYALHKIYIDNIHNKKVITKSVVIDYVNNLPPQKLMYSINYKLKQNIIEEHNLKVENMV